MAPTTQPQSDSEFPTWINDEPVTWFHDLSGCHHLPQGTGLTPKPRPHLLHTDGPFRALVHGFFTAAGFFARVRMDHVR